MAISIVKKSDTMFEVTVEERTTTIHHVTVSPDYYQKLTGGKVPVERLVERSFDFLLEREPNSAILRTFDLPLIQGYYPEYERTIREML